MPEKKPFLLKDRNQPRQSGSAKLAALTERIPGNDRFNIQNSDSSVEIELPLSPKESDALINHRLAESYSEKDSNELETKDTKKDSGKKVKKQTGPVSKMKKCPEIVTVDESEIEGHKIEEVRTHTGIDNLNSPLGKHVKIEFNLKKNPVKSD